MPNIKHKVSFRRYANVLSPKETSKLKPSIFLPYTLKPIAIPSTSKYGAAKTRPKSTTGISIEISE